MPEIREENTPPESKTQLISGVLLVSASVLEILAMAHHPTVVTSSIQAAVVEIGRLSHLTGLVHGVLIGLVLIIAYGFSEFMLRRGPSRPLIRAGAIAYYAGALVMIGAALVSGWIMTDFITLTPHVTDMDLQINRQILIFSGVVNQACANFAVVAMSAGIGLWSLDLCRSVGVPRMVGVLGLAIALCTIVAMFGGWLHLDIRGMSQVVAVQAVWNICIGAMFLQGKRGTV